MARSLRNELTQSPNPRFFEEGGECSDQTYFFLKRFLTEKSRKFGFDFAVLDMRNIQRRFHQNRTDLNRVLSELELVCLDNFTMPKKKIQWISGRYAVKRALFKYKTTRGEILDLSCIDILNGVNCAPYLVQFSDLRISITHSFPYCIGIVSEYPSGVDLERRITPQEALLEHFFHPHETRDLQKTGVDLHSIQATVYWTRKEAVSKLLGLGFKMNFRLIDTTSDFLVLENYDARQVRLNSFTFSDFCLSLAMEEPAN